MLYDVLKMATARYETVHMTNSSTFSNATIAVSTKMVTLGNQRFVGWSYESNFRSES